MADSAPAGRPDALRAELQRLLRHRAQDKGLQVRPDGLFRMTAVLRALRGRYTRQELEPAIQEPSKKEGARFQVCRDHYGDEWIRATYKISLKGIDTNLLNVSAMQCLERNPPEPQREPSQERQHEAQRRHEDSSSTATTRQQEYNVQMQQATETRADQVASSLDSMRLQNAEMEIRLVHQQEQLQEHQEMIDKQAGEIRKLKAACHKMQQELTAYRAASGHGNQSAPSAGAGRGLSRTLPHYHKDKPKPGIHAAEVAEPSSTTSRSSSGTDSRSSVRTDRSSTLTAKLDATNSNTFTAAAKSRSPPQPHQGTIASAPPATYSAQGSWRKTSPETTPEATEPRGQALPGSSRPAAAKAQAVAAVKPAPPCFQAAAPPAPPAGPPGPPATKANGTPKPPPPKATAVMDPKIVTRILLALDTKVWTNTVTFEV